MKMSISDIERLVCIWSRWGSWKYFRRKKSGEFYGDLAIFYSSASRWKAWLHESESSL